MDLNDLLKMTNKVGISSTRHNNADFISKLESQDVAAAGGGMSRR